MVEELKEAFRQFTFLSPKDLIELAYIAKLKRIKKGEHLVRVGSFNYNGVVVLKGLLSHYVIDENGMEKTLLFIPEKMATGAMETIINGKPADENIVALEDTLLLQFDIRKVDKLAEDNLRVLKMLNERYKQVISMAAGRIKFLTVLSPEELYTYFCKTYPDLEQRVKLKDLCSYLGITASSLSRMRARIAKS